MLDRAEVGRRVKKARKQLGLTQADLGTRLGAEGNTVSNWERGANLPSVDTLRALVRMVGKDLMWFIGSGPSDEEPADEIAIAVRAVVDRTVGRIPLLGTIQAGVPIDAQEDRIGTIYAAPGVNADFALRVRGDSMIGADLHEGDIILCQVVTWGEGVEPGRMVAALVDGQVTVKFLVQEDSRWLLRAANAAYPDIPLDDGRDRIQGLVVSIQKTRVPTAEEAANSAPPGLLDGLSPDKQRLAREMLHALRDR